MSALNGGPSPLIPKPPISVSELKKKLAEEFSETKKHSPITLSLRERILNSASSCLPVEKGLSTGQNEILRFHANLSEANTTASRIHLYTKFQTHFRSFLKFFGRTSTSQELDSQITHLNSQKASLLEAKQIAENDSLQLQYQDGEDPVIKKLRSANQHLLNSIDNALKETDKALNTACFERCDEVERNLAKLTTRYETGKGNTWISTSDFHKELTNLKTKLEKIPQADSTENMTNSPSVIKKDLLHKIDSTVQNQPTHKRFVLQSQILKPFLPSNIDLSLLSLNRNRKSEAVTLLDTMINESKLTGITYEHKIRLAEFFKDLLKEDPVQPKEGANNSPIKEGLGTSIRDSIIAKVLGDIKKDIQNWNTSQDAMFSPNNLQQKEWTSEASQHYRQERVMGALEMISGGDSPSKDEASTLLKSLNRFETDPDYKKKKVDLNYSLLKPLLIESGILSNQMAYTAFINAMNHPASNELVEKVIERHKIPGRPIKGSLLTYEDLLDLTRALETAKAKHTDKDLVEKKFNTTISKLKEVSNELIKKEILSPLQDILGPHHHLEEEVTNALLESLATYEVFKSLSTILKDMHEDKIKMQQWLETDNLEPPKTKYNLTELSLAFPTYLEKNPEKGVLLITTLATTLEQKVMNIRNSQIITDSMLLSLFDAKQLEENKLLPSTTSRELNLLAYQRKQKEANKLNPMESYFADNNYLHFSVVSMWTNSSWEVIQTPKDTQDKQLTKIKWKGQMAIPAGKDKIRRIQGSAVLDLHPLGMLSPDEQKSAMVFAWIWSNMLETVSPNDGANSHEKMFALLKQRDPASIPQLELQPSLLPLRLFLLNDPDYWEAVDKKPSLNTQEKKAYEEKSAQVFERYQKLLQVSSDFRTSSDKELLRMRSTIGNEDTPVISIK